MKVKCISICDPVTGNSVEKSFWLTVGKIYHVLAVYIGDGGPLEYRLVSDDGSTPGLYSGTQFKVVSDKLPSNWVATHEVGSFFELAPKSWSEPGFWERFFDDDPTAINCFEVEMYKIYSSEH